MDVLKRRRRRGCAAVMVMILFALAASRVLAETRQEYGIKAAFLLQFTRFVTWPEPPSGPAATAPFIVGVVGKDPFGPALDAIMNGQLVGDRKIGVRRFASWTDVTSCDLLYVSASVERETTDTELARFRGMLTISDQPRFCERGGGIRFFLRNQKVRFEINPAACEKSGLKVRSQLLQLAQVYPHAR